MAIETPNYTIGEYNETGEFVVRPMTDAEIADVIANNTAAGRAPIQEDTPE